MSLEDAIKSLTIEIKKLNATLLENKKPISKIDSSTLSVNEFCTLINISKSMFYKLLKSNTHPELKVIKIGSRTLISKEVADKWVKNNCQ